MKKISTNFGKRVLTMLGALALMGAVSANAAVYPLEMGVANTPEANDYYTYTAAENGYLLLTFTESFDMTGNEGVFFTYSNGWEDAVLDAASCDGEAGEKSSVFGCNGQYTQYTNVTKVAYQVISGTEYCVWGGSVNIVLPPFTATFSTELPDLGNTSGGGDTGDNTEFVWDEPFNPVVGKVYSFENTTIGSILTVKTKATINEKNADDMIFGEYLQEQILRGRVYTETKANSDGSFTAGADGYITVTYKLTSKQDYYFKCPVAGEYIFSLDTSDPYESMDPSSATPYFASPKPGVTAFFNFVVCWEIDGVDQDLTEGKMGGAIVTGPNEKNVGIKNYNLTTIGDGNRYIGLGINFNMDDAPTETGYYQLYLPKGIVLVDGKPNAEKTITFDYEPDNEWIPIDRELIEVTPSPDKYYNSIDGVELTFPYAIHYNDPDADYITVKVNDVEVEAEIVKGNTALSIPVEAVYSEATPYVVIEIAEQLVHDITESENPALEYTFALAAFDNNYTLAPESGMVLTEENSTVTLTWNDCVAVNLNSASDDTYDLSELGMTLVDEKGESVDLYFGENVDFYEDNGLAFDLSECAEGVYTLTIGAEAVQIVKSMGGGFGNESEVAVNNTIEATYYIGENAGVKEIQKIENLVAPVYNLQGVKVADSLNGLPEGIYIIKGKKIYVR